MPGKKKVILEAETYQAAELEDGGEDTEESSLESTEKVRDYISGVEVSGTPEEVEAVQPFSRRLVEEYGYEKKQIQTRPQFRVKTAPSGEERYPVDIAVFNNSKKTYDNVYMIVECKQPSRKDGLTQLTIYLNLVPSVEFGVWFNGKEHLYLRKITKAGRITWEEIPDIPKKGERVEDIGLYKRKDLIKATDLKAVFADLRNHLSQSLTGITRDEAIAQEIINILFCKLYDEINTAPNDQVRFRAGVGEDALKIKERIEGIFEDVKTEYDDVFEKDEKIRMDEASVSYVAGELQKYCITSADRDAVGDAFEVFIGPALRGGEGQFFTPRNVVRMIVELLDPQPGEYVIDPACGSGGFLIIALEHVWRRVDEEGKRKKWTEGTISKKKIDTASKFFTGIDKDAFLAKVTKSYMAIVGDGRGGIFCENSLVEPNEWQVKTQTRIQLGKFDVLFTNPPFGAKIPIKGEKILSQYDLGLKWKFSKKDGKWQKSTKLADKRAPQILFIERCLQLLRPGGRMGIVLPDSIIGNLSDGWIRELILSKAKLIGVIDCPSETFMPSTSTKTSVLLLQKMDDDGSDYEIFMATADKCGHDRRGKSIYKVAEASDELIPDDDFPEVVKAYRKFKGD